MSVIRRVLACVLLFVLTPAAYAAAQTPDTLRIVNTARVTYGSEGTSVTGEAASMIVVKLTAGIRFEPPREAEVRAGTRYVFAHTLTNTGTGRDRFVLGTNGPEGWNLALYLDNNANGVLDPGEPRVTGAVPLERNASRALLLVVDVPANAPAEPTDVTATATSEMNSSVSATVTDRLKIFQVAPSIEANKTVDRAEVTLGDTVTYTIRAHNRGDGAASDVMVVDTLPQGLMYIAGTMRLNGAPLSDADDADAGTVTAAGSSQVVAVRIAELVPDAAAEVSFRAVITKDAGTSIRNIAWLRHAGLTSPVMTPTAPAVTPVRRPSLALKKELLGTDSVRVGDLVRFRLSWRNLSNSLPVHEAVLTDSLPEGLQFVSAEPAGTVSGQVITWDLGSIAPGDSGQVLLTVRSLAYEGNAPLINRIRAIGANAAAVAAQAVPLYRLGYQGNELGLSHSAGVLEAGLGDVVPYTLTLHNKGETTLNNVVIVDTLPPGVEYSPNRIAGADSARVQGRVLTIWWSGPFKAQAKHTIQFPVAVTSPGSATSLVSRAYAYAGNGEVFSPVAAAVVRVRRGFAMQQRVVVGKVWIDRNGDGRQQDDEEGAAGVDIWTEEGTVVTTDRSGRFSFPNLRPGEHVLRIDTLSLPAGTMLPTRGAEITRARLDGWTLPRVDFRLVPREVAQANMPAQPAPPLEKSSADSIDTRRRARVAPLRTDSARTAEQKSSIVAGPVVRFTSPADGAVVHSNRLYVGVLGEPNAEVQLFDGDSLIAQGTLRPDGSFDFIGLEIAEGPHRLRVSMRNSWGSVQLDSIAVHRSGPIARIAGPAAPANMNAGDRNTSTVVLHAYDRWDVAIPGNASVTVSATGAQVQGKDADPSSVGLQLAVLQDGAIEVELLPGHDVGPGELLARAGDADVRVSLRVLPEITPLRVTGTGQVGAGAAADAFGAVTARGSLGTKTTISLSYDTRRDPLDENYFGRGFDPLDEGRYPTLGDGSRSREVTPSSRRLTARMQHGFDVLELGDVRTEEFGLDQRLGYYQRALTGASGRVTTGPLAWRAYGSVTDQVLTQQQLRGDGTSGPYTFGAGIRAGTERVAIEVRALENAARVVSRQELRRYNDYQIDYVTGQVLLNQPVPASDPAGNPVFIVAMLERRTGEASSFVGGLRMDFDATSLMRAGVLDTLEFSVLGVRETRESMVEHDFGTMFGGGVRLRHGAVSASTQLLGSAHGDSTATASVTALAWSPLSEKVKLAGELLDVGAGFSSGSDPRLAQGMRELRLSANLNPASASHLRLTHELQRFDGYDVERQATALEAGSTLLGRKLTAKAGLTSDAQGTADSRSANGKLTAGVREGLDMWIEGSRLLSDSSAAAVSRPSQLGVGVGLKLSNFARLEGAHRWLEIHGDSSLKYQLSSVSIKTEPIHGAQVSGGIEHADDKRAGNSAVLGWNQRVVITGGLTATGMFERRFGLNRAPLLDPSRALPFAQIERDRWSAGAGLEWLPTDSLRGRASVRGELHGGRDGEGFRFDVAGDVPLGTGASLLTRHNWLRNQRRDFQGGSQFTRSDHSLLGLALRPASTDAVALLAKLEWRVDENPIGNALLGTSGEQRRLIGALDAVWAVRPGSELAMRYAARRATFADTMTSATPIESFAHFTGARVTQLLYGPVSARADGRMLIDGNSGTAHWNLAPALVAQLGNGLELEAGYRFGGLRDLDFAAQGGTGFYVTMNLRFTERFMEAGRRWTENRE